MEKMHKNFERYKNRYVSTKNVQQKLKKAQPRSMMVISVIQKEGYSKVHNTPEMLALVLSLLPLRDVGCVMVFLL